MIFYNFTVSPTIIPLPFMNKFDTQEKLYRIAQEDDQIAFKDLYAFYFFKLVQFCNAIVRCREAAEEIINDVFINMWKRRSHLYKIENFDVYVYVAVKNQSLDYLSRNHFKEVVDIGALSGEYLKFSVDPEQLMITAEMKKKIEKAVDQLPPRCRLIFKLIKEDGLKYQEVAGILGISIKTVEAQLSIAMKRLTSAIIFSSEGALKKQNTGQEH